MEDKQFLERYKEFIGKTLILPLVGREIPVVADDFFDDDDEDPLEAVANAMDAASNDDGSDKKEE